MIISNKTQNYQISNSAYFIFIALIAFILLMPDVSFAATAGTSDPISKAMCNIYGMMRGTAAKVIGSIAIIFLAVGLFVGKISWGVAVATGVGIACMFGADTLVGVISGGDGKDPCGTSSTSIHDMIQYFDILIDNHTNIV